MLHQFVQHGHKLDNFCAKKFTFGSNPLPLSKILVALLVAIAVADRFLRHLSGPDTKRSKKRYRPYTSRFLDINTNLLK